MVKRIGVVSNPRSGTSLLVRLLLLGLDRTNTLSVVPGGNGTDIYEYRILPKDLKRIGSADYYVVLVVRDPRAVITSRHPASPSEFFIDFENWYTNHLECTSLGEKINLCQIRFEDLVSDPDRVQEHVATELSLPIVKPFSLCTNPDEQVGLARQDEMAIEMGTVRPFDMEAIHRWKLPQYRERIRDQLLRYPEMVDILIKLGYEKNGDWTTTYF